MSTRPPAPRLLLVEDDPDIQVVLRVALEKLGGFEVAVCGSGREALDQAARRPPGLVLLDVMMPDLDGPATLAALRARFGPALPVVFVTARAQPEEMAHYRRMGAVEVIVKPFDPLTLPQRIGEIWRRLAAADAQPAPTASR